MKKINTDYETEEALKKLNNITENGGTNSKQFWNLVRSIKRNNTEGMYFLVNIERYIEKLERYIHLYLMHVGKYLNQRVRRIRE